MRLVILYAASKLEASSSNHPICVSLFTFYHIESSSMRGSFVLGPHGYVPLWHCSAGMDWLLHGIGITSWNSKFSFSVSFSTNLHPYLFRCQTKVTYQKRPSKSVIIWPWGPNSYLSKISGKCTRTDRSAIWWYFASITLLRLVMYDYIRIPSRQNRLFIKI